MKYSQKWRAIWVESELVNHKWWLHTYGESIVIQINAWVFFPQTKAWLDTIRNDANSTRIQLMASDADVKVALDAVNTTKTLKVSILRFISLLYSCDIGWFV